MTRYHSPTELTGFAANASVGLSVLQRSRCSPNDIGDAETRGIELGVLFCQYITLGFDTGQTMFRPADIPFQLYVQGRARAHPLLNTYFRLAPGVERCLNRVSREIRAGREITLSRVNALERYFTRITATLLEVDAIHEVVEHEYGGKR